MSSSFKFYPEKFTNDLLKARISSVIRRSSYPPNQQIGLELELEGFNATMMPGIVPGISNCLWTTHNDPSLRGDSCELVLARPVSEKELVEKALPQYEQILSEARFKPALSNRCSFHVHLDFSHKTVYDLIRFIVVYSVFEPYFFEAVGPQRKGNHFCLSLREAESYVDSIIAAFLSGRFDFCIPEDNRYMALNLAALGKFGSVEIRLHEGVCETARIKAWVDVLMELLNYAKTEYSETPQQLLESISMNGLKEITKAKFPKTWELIGPKFDNVLMRDGLDIAQDIAYAGSWEDAPKEPLAATSPKKSQDELPPYDPHPPQHLELGRGGVWHTINSVATTTGRPTGIRTAQQEVVYRAALDRLTMTLRPNITVDDPVTDADTLGWTPQELNEEEDEL